MAFIRCLRSQKTQRLGILRVLSASKQDYPKERLSSLSPHWPHPWRPSMGMMFLSNRSPARVLGKYFRFITPWKDRFHHPNGLYEYPLMQFELRNMSGAWKCVTNSFLKGIKWTTCLGYIDNVVFIFASCSHIWTVFMMFLPSCVTQSHSSTHVGVVSEVANTKYCAM